VLRFISEIDFYFHFSLILTLLVFIGAGMAITGYLKKDRLPPLEHIEKPLFQSPTQRMLQNGRVFPLAYGGKEYKIQEVAEYEIYGLVATHNNILAWTDIYHDETSLDTKDLCLIWGDNLKNDHYRHARFKSGAWTCYVKWKGGDALALNQLSNNHLITDKPEVREAIRRVQVGDQVHIIGKLANYKEVNARDWRISSVSRDDKGGRACEVVLVEKIEVLHHGRRLWRQMYEWGIRLMLMAATARVFFYFLF
jgi:hypothetical protein